MYSGQLAEEIALTLDGEKRKLNIENFINLGKGLGLTDNQSDSAFSRLFFMLPAGSDLSSCI
jgi:hypothetical protein